MRPRKDKRGVDLISDALPHWTGESANEDAIGYAKAHAKFGCGEIRVIDAHGSIDHELPTDLRAVCCVCHVVLHREIEFSDFARDS